MLYTSYIHQEISWKFTTILKCKSYMYQVFTENLTCPLQILVNTPASFSSLVLHEDKMRSPCQRQVQRKKINIPTHTLYEVHSKQTGMVYTYMDTVLLVFHLDLATIPRIDEHYCDHQWVAFQIDILHAAQMTIQINSFMLI